MARTPETLNPRSSVDDQFIEDLYPKREMERYQREAELVAEFVDGDPPRATGGMFKERFSREEIANRLHQAGFISDPATFIGRVQLWRQLRRPHQTSLWKRYRFQRIEEETDEPLYAIVFKDKMKAEW